MPGISLDQAATIVRGSCYGSAVEIDNIFCSNHEKKSNEDVVGMP